MGVRRNARWVNETEVTATQMIEHVGCLLAGPLSMMQNIDSLKYTSYAAVASILYVLTP